MCPCGCPTSSDLTPGRGHLGWPACGLGCGLSVVLASWLAKVSPPPHIPEFHPRPLCRLQQDQ